MTNESRPRMMPVHSPILQVRQNLRDAEAENANLRDLLNKSIVENVELLRQVVVMQEALYEAQGALLSANKRVDELISALINIGDALFKNYILAFAVRDVSPSIEELTRACETLNKTLSAHRDETITPRQQLDEAQGDCNKWHDAYVALLKWSQSAYKRLGGLMTIGVSMTPDAVTAKLLSDAPANVSAEVDPFSAEVDAMYSIYTDPLIVGIAKSMECTIDDLVEYAYESVGYPKDDAE